MSRAFRSTYEVTIERCTNCGQNMRIELDVSLNGNHVISCPHCAHEHCRVVENGKVTGVRWATRNQWNFQPQTPVYYSTGYAVGYDSTSSTGSTFTNSLWTSTTAGTGDW